MYVKPDARTASYSVRAKRNNAVVYVVANGEKKGQLGPN